MAEWIKIRMKDYYQDIPIGEEEYTYVKKEVYELLTNTFRKEAYVQQIRDIRNRILGRYTEGDTEDFLMETAESLEEIVIRQLEIELLQKAMQALTETQKVRKNVCIFIFTKKRP